MKKILITGGAGYLGSVMTGFLLNRGHSVTVLDRLLYDVPTLLHYCSNENFEYVKGDARDECLMKELLKSHDVIIPLAAIVGAGACDRDPLMATSVNRDAVVMMNRLRSKEQWVISPCTNSGYGTKTGDMYCTEETPLDPISLYGKDKVEAESDLLGSPNAMSLRLATVFGPSPRIRLDLLVNDFTYRAVTDRFLVIYEKDFKRNYVHVEDVAECFAWCIDNFESVKGEPYNFGLNEANLSKAELAEKIKEHAPALYIHYAEVGTDPDKRNYIVSNEKLKQKGFEAKISLDRGIGQLIKAYRMLPRGAFRNV